MRGLTVAKYYLHPFEEPFLSPSGKSGTVFFGGCSLRCVFCQNFELSRAKRGKEVTPKELADIFRELENQGAENLDLVTPDHVVPLLAEALALYKPRVPVIYNSSGYALVSALEEIAPFVDVWLPDMKFADPALAERYTGRRDYPAVAAEAIAFMAQTPVRYGADGKLCSGVAVRHLVLPSRSSDSLRVLDLLRPLLPDGAPLSVMRQYIPAGDLSACPELGRRVTAREYKRVTDYAAALGFSPLYVQGKDSADASFVPDWDF